MAYSQRKSRVMLVTASLAFYHLGICMLHSVGFEEHIQMDNDHIFILYSVCQQHIVATDFHPAGQICPFPRSTLVMLEARSWSDPATTSYMALCIAGGARLSHFFWARALFWWISEPHFCVRLQTAPVGRFVLKKWLQFSRAHSSTAHELSVCWHCEHSFYKSSRQM